ncbi:unnamed protein product [Brachionus calyciflorus]|uniref:Uncharacterized protein n=1 Tax=Brachionus calyciflorus TaxID=104777 RepID=A0A814AVG0_9BILA|nr:unnamed protein product [Brachionus calyciflorus]
MSLVASRGINKRSGINLEAENYDDISLIEAIKENNLNIKIPLQTKKRLIRSLLDKNIKILENDSNSTGLEEIKDSASVSESFQSFQEQLDRIEQKFNQISEQEVALSSIGKIAAILFWDTKFKLNMDGMEKTIAIISITIICFFFLDLVIFLVDKFSQFD